MASDTCPVEPCPWCTLEVAHEATTQDVRAAWHSHHVQYINAATALGREYTEKLQALQFIFTLRGESAWPKPRSSTVEPDEHGHEEPTATNFKGHAKRPRVQDEQAAASSTSARGSSDARLPWWSTPWSRRAGESHPHAASSERPRWQYQGGKKMKWVDYDDVSAFKLEVAYVEQEAQCVFWIGEWEYCVKLDQLPFVQVSLCTGAERGVRRIGPGEPESVD